MYTNRFSPWMYAAFLIQLCISTQAQQYTFDHKRLAPMLSQHTVNHIVQDKYGLMWFATQDGVNVYDGYEMRHYRNHVSDSFSLLDNFTFAVVEDADGDCWIGTRSGPTVYLRNSGRFVHPKASDLSWIVPPQSFFGLAASADKQTIALVFQGGLYKVNAREAKQTLNLGMPIAGASCKQPVIDKHDRLWFTDGDSLRVLYNNSRNSKGIAPLNGLTYAMLIHSSGSVFLATDTALWIYKDTIHSLQRIEVPNPMHLEIRTLCETMPKGEVWVGGQYGICVISTDTHKRWVVKKILQHDPLDESSIPESKIFHIYRDRSGLLWIGSSQHGVSQQTIQKGLFTHFTHKASASPTISSNVVWCVQQTGDNDYAIGTTNGLNIATIDKSRGVLLNNRTTYMKDEQNAGLSVYTMLLMPGRELLLGTQRGLYRFNLSSGDYRRVECAASACTLKIMGISRDSIGHIWLATSQGFYLYDHLKKTIIPVNQILTNWTESRHGYCLATFAASKHTVWVGSTSGFSCIDTRTGTTLLSDKNMLEKSKKPPVVSAFQQDTLGRIWVATLGSGVYIVQKDGKLLYHLDEAAGLCNNVVYGLLPDSFGHFWIPTNNGLMQMHPYTLRHVTYTQEDGLPTNEFSQNGWYQDAGGYLWFGSTEGLVLRLRQSVTTPGEVFTPVLTGLELNYVAVKPGAAELKGKSLESLTLLELDSRQKVVSFSFASMYAGGQGALSYEYMLQGFDKTWALVSSNRRVATYSNLPPGTYMFRVRSLYEKLRRSPKELQITLVVTPPFWLTWWFQFLAGIFLVGTLVLLGWFLFKKKLKIKNKELAVLKEVQEERERISRDLHDHVGAQITYMIAKLDHLQYKVPASETLSGKLEAISIQARATMQLLRETIWAIHQEHITLLSFQQKMEEFLNSAFNGMEEFTYETFFESDKPYALKPVKALNLFRITQEAVTNAIKYSGGSKVVVEVKAHNETMVVSIRDNGKGFQGNMDTSAQALTGIGLQNMRNRADAADAQIAFYNAEGANVEVRTQVSML
jgi:ligand-binding sensor domain-containing protein/two-component sensor histidine kinase